MPTKARLGESDMLTIFYNLSFKLRQMRVERFTEAVCNHMLYIYNYFYRSQSPELESAFVKEAVGLLHNWEQISENIYKHKPSGATIEIRKGDKIEPVTKKVLEVEIPSLAKTKSQLMIRLLTEKSAEQIDQYFKENRIIGR